MNFNILEDMKLALNPQISQSLNTVFNQFQKEHVFVNIFPHACEMKYKQANTENIRLKCGIFKIGTHIS